MHKIGIMGGTFNPVHNGHLMLARQSYFEYKLDKVIFMPAGRPPHKQDMQILNDTDRLNMLQAARGTPLILRSVRMKFKKMGFLIHLKHWSIFIRFLKMRCCILLWVRIR